MASRSLTDLTPEVRGKAEAMLAEAKFIGLDVLVYCTLRGAAEQARLYRQGRSLARIEAKVEELRTTYRRLDLAHMLLNVGPQRGATRVTQAGPGQSLHNYGLAFDAVPLRDGKPVWGSSDPVDLELWQMLGGIAKRHDLEWGGDWRFSDFVHFQQPGVDWRQLIRSEYV